MQSFQRPENALKRANELLSIGQQDAALKILHNAIGHRRFRSQGWDSVQEAIMLCHVQLCVDEGKIRLARDGLHQYRIISQHANIQSLGKVIVELRTRAEMRLAAAKSKIVDDNLDVDNIIISSVDLDQDIGNNLGGSVVGPAASLGAVGTNPETLLLSTLQIEVRTTPEARSIHETLRAVWDIYKMILDLLRTTPKLEKVYHETARRAFIFCKENHRPQEFKRLCDVLRNHFQLILKNRNKEDYEFYLLKPELHLETRMQQLVTASELELWRECSSTAEDLINLGLNDYFLRCVRMPATPNVSNNVSNQNNNNVFNMSGNNLLNSSFLSDQLYLKTREKLLRWMAIYYEKMAKVMWVGENYLFHALAWIKYLLHVKGFKRNVPQSVIQEMANIAVLAVLAVPQTISRNDELGVDNMSLVSYEQERRIATILGHGSVPTRESLMGVLKSRDILAAADSVPQQLYSLLESEFTPLKLCSLCYPLLQEMSDNPQLNIYITPLKRVIFGRLIEQLSRVYVRLTIDHFTQHICPEEFLPWSEAEKLVVGLVVHQPRGCTADSSGSALSSVISSTSSSLSIRLDYATRAILFETNDAVAYKNSCKQVSDLARSLSCAVKLISPGVSADDEQEREMFARALGPRLEAEAVRMRERLTITNLRRLEKQEEQQKLEEEKRRQEVEQRRVEEKQEKDRREEASKRREERRQQEERFKARSETAAQMLDEIKKISGRDNKILIKGKHLTDINIEDVLQGTVNYDDLELAQRLQLNKERMVRVRQRRQNYRRVCHFVRASREEELPLLEIWKKEELEADTKILLAVQNRREEEHKAAFAAALEEKRVFESFKSDKESWVAERMAERIAEYEISSREQRERLIAVLKAQKIQRAKERKEEHYKKLRLEAEKKRAEEEQKRIQEEVEKSEQEAKLREQKLAKSAEIQRAKELDIERQLQEAKEQSSMIRSNIVRATQDSQQPFNANASTTTTAATVTHTATATKNYSNHTDGDDVGEWRRNVGVANNAETPDRQQPQQQSRMNRSNHSADSNEWRSSVIPQNLQKQEQEQPEKQVQKTPVRVVRKPETNKVINQRAAALQQDDEGFTVVVKKK